MENVLKHKKMISIILVAIIATGIIFLQSKYSFAVETLHEGRQAANTYIADDPEVLYALETLQENDIDSVEAIHKDVLRYVGFGVIKILAKLIDGLFDALKEVIDFLSFSYSKDIVSLTSKYSVLYKIIFIITITGFGLYLMLGKTNLSELNTTTCVILIAIIITSMPLLTQKFSQLTAASSNYVMNQWSKIGSSEMNSISTTAINSQIYDLCVIDKNIKKGKVNIKKGGMNNLDAAAKDYNYLDINKELDDDVYELENAEVFRYQREKGSDGKYILTELHHPIMPNTYYYRYQVKSWLYIIVTLATACAALALMLIRVARLVIEVAMANIYIPFVAVTDIASGQRIKEAMKGFITLFAAIFLAIAMFGIFILGFAYINLKIESEYLKYIMLIALAWAVIDGSDNLERTIGIDTGVKSGWQMLAGVATAGKVGKSAGKFASSPLRAANRVRKSLNQAKDSKLRRKLSEQLAENQKDRANSGKDGKNEKNNKDGNSKKNKELNMNSAGSKGKTSGNTKSSKKGMLSGKERGKRSIGKGNSSLGKGKTLSPAKKSLSKEAKSLSLKHSPKSLDGTSAVDRKINRLKAEKVNQIRQRIRHINTPEEAQFKNRIKEIDIAIEKLKSKE